MSNCKPCAEANFCQRLFISVIVPVYNGAGFLREALDSVTVQNYTPIEIIVIDDGSTDTSALVIRSFAEASLVPLRYVFQTNQGPGAARNRGIGLARGELIAFLDQDDLWLPDKVERQVARLRQDPALGYVLTMSEFFLDAGLARPEWLRPEQLSMAQVGFLPSCLLARRRVFEQIGLFDSTQTTSSDADWFFRAKDACVPMAVIPKVLVRHRIHLGNQTRLVSKIQAELATIVRRSVQRKRQEEAIT